MLLTTLSEKRNFEEVDCWSSYRWIQIIIMYRDDKLFVNTAHNFTKDDSVT